MHISPVRYRQIAIGALIALAIIIVTGAAVRLTNSGLGCDDWPKCSSERFVDVSSPHAAVEQLNRLFTGVVGVAVIAAVLGSFVRTGPRRRDLVRLSLLLVLGVIGNAVLGGISVLVDLNPIAVQGHLLLSMACIVAGTVLVRRAGEPDGVPRRRTVSRPTQRLTWVLGGVIGVVLFTGTLVTGAGPHAGDADAERLGLAIPAVARVHGVAMLTSLAIIVLIAWRIRTIATDRRVLTSVLSTWIVVGLMQAAIGYIQYFSGVPALLVGLHVAGATAVTFVTTQMVLATSTPDPARTPDTPPTHDDTPAHGVASGFHSMS
ncbi:MAG: COX15/CtaA family protein [Ilumatobacteraceae bacterium]